MLRAVASPGRAAGHKARLCSVPAARSGPGSRDLPGLAGGSGAQPGLGPVQPRDSPGTGAGMGWGLWECRG